MSNYPSDSLATWVIVNRDGEIVETDYLEDCPSSSTPLEDYLSSSTSLKEERETLEKDQNEILVNYPFPDMENLQPFPLDLRKSEVVCEPDVNVDLGESEVLPVSDQDKNTNLTEKHSSKSISQSSEETDETDSDLIHLSQEDVDDSFGNILDLSVDFSSNSSQFSNMNGDNGALYDDCPRDEVDSDVSVLNVSHDSLDSLVDSLDNLKDSFADSIIDNSSIQQKPIDLRLIPKIRQYKHIPNNRLNVALTVVMMLSVTIVVSLAIGHFLGAGRQWIALTKKAFVLEELKLQDMVEHLPKNTIDFWRKKYKEQLTMNERLKTVLASDSQQMNLKEMSRNNQEFHQSKLDIMLQLEHLQILKDLQVVLLDLQLKEHERKVNSNELKTKGKENNIEVENKIDFNSIPFNQESPVLQSDELIVVSDQKDVRSSNEAKLITDIPEKASTDPVFYEATSSINLVDSEEKSSLIIAVEDDNIVSETSQKSYVEYESQTPIPLLPPPPPENMNEMMKTTIEVKVNHEEESKSEPQKFNYQLKFPHLSTKVDNQEILIQSLKSRILHLQQENNELRAEMTYLRNKQRNIHNKEAWQHLPTSDAHSPFEQVSCKKDESPNDKSKKCTNDNTLFNLSKTLHYYWHQFDKFTSKSINQLHNLPVSHLFNKEELVKKLNHTKNAFYTLQNNLAQKWTELYSVENTTESFHQTAHEKKDPLWRMGNILQRTWNKVKNISQNFFVKEGSTVKKLAKKVSEKLGRIENTLEKKWSELNEKLNKKLFSHSDWKEDKKWNKKEKKYLNKIHSRCNGIMEKIKGNPIWFDHIQGSRNPYFSEEFQIWLKEEKFFEDDEHEVKAFWKDLRKMMKYPDQKELMWLLCQYKWWQPNNIQSDVVCIGDEDTCKTEENHHFRLNKMKPSQEKYSKIFWVFGRAEDREKQRSESETRNNNWFFNRARLRDSLREKPHPKSEWIFKRAEDRKYQRLFQSEFQDSWKIYDWLNKRAEIRKHLRYLDGFN